MGKVSALFIQSRTLAHQFVAGTSPAITSRRGVRAGVLALARPDQDQAERGQRRAVAGPLNLFDHETRRRPVDHPQALADPEQADGEREQAKDQKQLAHGSPSLAGRLRSPSPADRSCRSNAMPAGLAKPGNPATKSGA